jgi:hypothetical protein
MDQLFWEEALTSRLRFQRIAVLHGNIHDEFPPGRRSLDRVLDRVAKAVECGEVHRVSGAADRPIEKLAPKGNTPAFWIFEHAQAQFPHVQTWDRNAWESHAQLLAKIDAGRSDRFIFVFPDEGRIPANFLAGIPGVVRFAVPWPDQQERRRWVNQSEYFSKSFKQDERRLMAFVAGTDGLHWRDLEAIREKCGGATDPVAIVREFKFGRSKDHWKQLLDDRGRFVKAMHDFIHGADPIRGQDEAVGRALSVVAKACLDLAQITAPSYNRPRGVLFLVGPTGVGKTMLAKKLARLIFGDDESCLVFDMSEYSQDHSDGRLIGAPPGFVGYDEGGQLTSAVRRKPFSVVLFDEIDKAHPSILTKFMQLLDEGRLTDGKGQTCYFSESLVIFTSNAGALALAEGTQTTVTVDSPFADLQRYYQERLQEAPGLREHPEILNRIGLGNIVPFRHIRDERHVLAAIGDLINAAKEQVYAKHKVPIRVEDEETLTQHIADRSAWRQFGIRNVKQAFEITVLEPIAQAILARPLDDITVRLESGREVVVV